MEQVLEKKKSKKKVSREVNKSSNIDEVKTKVCELGKIVSPDLDITAHINPFEANSAVGEEETTNQTCSGKADDICQVESNSNMKDSDIKDSTWLINEKSRSNNTLMIDCKTSIKDIRGINKFDSLLIKNREIMKSICLDVEIPKGSKVESQTATVQNIIRPYAEVQLAAFYSNTELDMLEDFCSCYIEAELKGLGVKQNHLYELLLNYLHIREKIIENTLELEQLRKEYKELQCQLWTVETATVSGRGECQDGVTVFTSHSYNKAIFHRSAYQSIFRVLGSVQQCTYENHILYSYSAEDLRLQIELYLQSTITNCMAATELKKDSPISLQMQTEPGHLKQCLIELRLCISTIFAFQRKFIRDSQFIKETREWLSRLIAVLLRIANYQDHLFILHHILRCPSGVGSWAACFLQTPILENLECPFSNHQVNHILAVLACILSPIREREKFLEDIAQIKDMGYEALWVMVDSDGEEDEEPSGTSLRENDLVALMNQLPLDSLFRSLLQIKRQNFQDSYDDSRITEHHIIRFLAFSTVLLRILHKGLQTYHQQKYHQFAKRLSRLIRHIVQYTTDQWEQFNKEQKLQDSAMLQRLQVEYDAFFLRAIYSLYSSQKLGAWQFLAVVPYNAVTSRTMWKIFYFLHDADDTASDLLNPLDETDYAVKIWAPEVRVQFLDKLGNLTDAESYYLLNTFANMALGRTEKDFIKTATLDLLQIGFICEVTQETCSKSSRILLTHITSKHPQLLSDILKCVNENIRQIGPLVLYLYEELPLTVWSLKDEDLEILTKLLTTSSVNQVESKLVRMIFSRLNWGFNSDGKLFLPYDMHCDCAILVVHIADKEPSYLNWAWQTIFRLKLHISDRGFSEIARVPDIDRFDILLKGVREKQPLHSFVSLLMTSWGHLVPLICSKGLGQLLALQFHQKHEAVLFALYLIMPLFINSQECIINCTEFQEILSNLLNADRSYMSIAKSLISTQNTILQQFGNMIETQIVNHEAYGLKSPRCLVRLWMNSLVSVPNWSKDYGVLYLLDVIIRASFFHSDALEVVESILKELLQCSTPQEHSGTIGSLFKWVSSSNSNNSLITSSLSTFTWLAYVMINIEHEEREKKTGIWKEILLQLNNQKTKVNVDSAIKKAASLTKRTSFSSVSLSIYRWAQQALDTPIDHPLLPLLWQKFFALYLTRLPVSRLVDRACVGDKFFEGIVNFTFLKKMKKRLQETLPHYQVKLDDMKEENDNVEKKLLYQTCLKMFQAYSLWLEEPRLHESNLLLLSLPPQYESSKLNLLLEGNSSAWYELLDYPRIKQEQQEAIRVWKVSNFREKTNVNKPLPNAGSRVESEDPVERILRRLTSYDAPKAAPQIYNSAPIVPVIDFSNTERMLSSLTHSFQTLKQFAHNQMLRVSEHKTLDCFYQELIPQLYKSVPNKVTKKVPCKTRNQSVHCSGVVSIILQMQEARINGRIEHQIETNRNEYESLLTKSLQAPAMSLCAASVSIQHTIKILQSQLKFNPVTAELGVELFYYILSSLNEETLSYFPTKTLFSSCLEKLGQSHIYGVETEMPRLLEKILKEPNLGGYLAPHFSPSNIGTSSLLFMYSTICKEIGQKFDVSFALLSKFDVDNWLLNKHPKISQRSQFIECIIKALTNLGYEPPLEAMMLHGLYRKHLLYVFEFQFPEHYGEVLINLLKVSNGSSESSPLAVSVWLDVLNSLSKPVPLHLKVPLRDQLRLYAQTQQNLRHQEILETAELLSRHFTEERLQFGLYGLYPKNKLYLDVYVILLGMTGHALVISSLNTHQGLLADKMCEKIWPYLRDIFVPWIAPYSMQNLKDTMATWIQQLADDRSVLLPWIIADVQFAQRIINMFIECILFLIHILPACGVILNYIWQWYVISYAHNSVKEHILHPIHGALMTLPWHNFWPTINDLELMLKVVDQYLPECHLFLGHLFLSTSWINWMHSFANCAPQLKTRIYQCFLNLLVKLSNEPNVRSKHVERVNSLLVQAEGLEWYILEPHVYQHVMDWYILSCDSIVIFKNDPMDLDFRVLHFLKVVSGYNDVITNGHNDVYNKRLVYLKSYIKLLSIFTNRHKSSVPSKEKELYAVIDYQMKHLERTVHSQEELQSLLYEFLNILNISSLEHIALKCICERISNKSGNDLVITVLLRTLGLAVSNHECIATLYEMTLNSYFQNNVTENFEPNWTEVSEIIKIVASKQTALEQVLLSKGSILTLNALLVHRMTHLNDHEALLNLCLDWLTNIKLSEHTEAKIPLIWLAVLNLTTTFCEIDEPSTYCILYKFSQILLQTAEEKNQSGWGRGLLSAIGINKQGTTSVNFRFLCRALAGYVLAQLPDVKGGTQVVRHQANAPARVGQPGGNTECAKVLLKLDFGQSQGKIKECAEMALNQIQDANNSLHNASQFLIPLVKQFYTKTYLRDVRQKSS